MDIRTTEQTSAVGVVARSTNTSITEAYAIDWRGKESIQREPVRAGGRGDNFRLGVPWGRRIWEWEQLHVHERSLYDYEELYSLDILGVEYRGENGQLDVLRDFKRVSESKTEGMRLVFLGYRELH